MCCDILKFISLNISSYVQMDLKMENEKLAKALLFAFISILYIIDWNYSCRNSESCIQRSSSDYIIDID